ncbi:MAG TPA: Holliday junction resolvase RuvX [Bdellovibrionota bacterium]|nr:Holliday junction resolvase RuvX [Bdellovibrionota bacterium]
MKYLSLDIGDKRIGVAGCDDLMISVQGITVIQRKNRDTDLQAIAKLIDKYKPEGIVIGIPLNDENQISKQGEKIQRFVERLRKKISLPVYTCDERYSSREAGEVLIQRKESGEKQIDRVAAAIILQRFLDAKKGSTT